MSIIKKIEQAQIEKLKGDKKIPAFKSGDTVKVHVKIKDGDKFRIQVFEGVVIARDGGDGNNASFTVRRESYGVGVERADAASRGGDRGAFGLDRVLQVGRGRAALHGVARPNGPRVVAGRRGREAGANTRGARASRERAGAEHGLGAAERRVRLGDAGVRVGGRDVPSG